MEPVRRGGSPVPEGVGCCSSKGGDDDEEKERN